MTEGVLVVDGRGRILLVNDALRRLLSLSSDVSDKMPLEIIRNAELEGAIRKAIQDGENIALELDLDKSGEKTIEVNVVSILLPAEGWMKTAKESEAPSLFTISLIETVRKIHGRICRPMCP
jgi:PAS domain-containing protein